MTATPPSNDFDLTNPPFPLTALDRQLLATNDSDFHLLTWDELRTIIATNHLEVLKRLPSDVRKYLRWSHATKQAYGSMNAFVVQERLRWTPIDPTVPISATSFEHFSDEPFADPRDYKVLLNDWPYGFEPGVVHLLVWTKTPIAVDEERGDVTTESRELIERFVETLFVSRVAERCGLERGEAWKRVMWFKNWESLQSVRGVPHVHVLVKDVPEGLIGEWLGR